MRKKIAALLTGCLLLQSLTGFVIPSQKAYAKTAEARMLSESQPAQVSSHGKRTAQATTGSLEI